MIKETISPSPGEDHCMEFRYETGEGACLIKRAWVDETEGGHSFWIESQDGQRVVIPEELRKLIAKRCREATFR